ncbi:AFG1-like ATPase [Hyaloscypha variabilis F]|uniref:AFG1-like ATPase n=1 Tax=Hyaloscypha variabilis (strain UAMH 11265 / GT02V1 / F) TaxID=1149755 RepID=A0A2J6R009_HYAVF|nr:AFG1-like ATPase [Hyaloscypha variabilis F]
MSKTSLQAAYAALLTHQRLSPNPSQAALVTRLARLQADLTIPYASPKGVYIYGSVGIGKSRIVDLFASTLPPSVSSRRIHFHEFMMDIHTRLHHARSQATFAGDPLLQIGRDVRNENRVLCFDEFQVTDIADALILRRLFGSIWESCGVVVATSNRRPEALYENGLNRSLFLPFIEELRNRCEVWKLEGSEDYRMRSEGVDRRVKVFFTNDKAFRRNFMDVMSGAEMKQVVIPVLMNRQIQVSGITGRDGKLVVSSSFEDLCQNFLGSADYYALCKASGVIYLSGLRKFRADELDFVRRFITLVDLAYETKTRIVCLSTVPLFEVFSNIVPRKMAVEGQLKEDLGRHMTVKGEGGSSSSMMSTFIGEMEWSATGLENASLASGGAGETDVGFAIGRAVSRLYEMGSPSYGVND